MSNTMESRMSVLETRMNYVEADNLDAWKSIRENKALTRSIDKRLAFFLGIGFVLQVFVIPVVVAWAIKHFNGAS